MLVSCVHPVAILRAVFCTICSLSMFVSDALGDHMVEAYSSTGLVMALYVASMGERTPPCGTPDLNCRFVDVWFLNFVYAMRPLM